MPEVVMESTAQYWQPVWQMPEGKFHLELARAQSNRAPRGRKSDFRDAERLWRRYLADELALSFVPDPEQRLWRTPARTRTRWMRDKSRLQNRLEALLEEMRIKLSGTVRRAGCGEQSGRALPTGAETVSRSGGAERTSGEGITGGTGGFAEALRRAGRAAGRSARRYRRILGRDPKKHNKAIRAVAHHLCRVIWNILHKAVRYQEKGNRPDPRAVRRRATRLLRQLTSLERRGFSTSRLISALVFA